MKRLLISASFCLLLTPQINAQKYQFKTLEDVEKTQVKMQGKTGTCWSFSTTSFIESEVIRIHGKKIDLSEMFTVRSTYSDKAKNYLYRQGKAQFSEGGLAHDVMNSVAKNGLVPEQQFTGLDLGQTEHNHAEMVAVLKSMLDTYIKKPAKKLSPKWRTAVESVLDVYLGTKKETFEFEGKKYTPKSFAKYLQINPADYVTITSFESEKKYDKFILSIPDNFSNGLYHNVSLDELVTITEEAIKNGFTVALGSDVSEETFSGDKGIAVVPAISSENKKALEEIVVEKKITPTFRQAEFDNFNTTDDHLMHIVGIVKDQKGNRYFKVKNSWGKERGIGGYIHMSTPYFKLKTISVLLHKDALSNDIKNKLAIK